MNEFKYMSLALKLAKKGKYTTSPNPMVGAVIVKDGKILATGYHKKAGQPHAEINALSKLNFQAQNCEMYVTLEPCSHYGRTPPCADAIIRSGIRKVVIATLDPNPLVNGKGVEKLKNAGIEVVCGVLEEKAKKLNEKFFKYITTKIPFVALKIAQTLDGKIALKNGESKWITSEKSREYVHKLRMEYDAVLTGIGTILKDDPQLNVRLKKVYKQPLRIILDSKLKIPLSAKVLEDPSKVIILTTALADKEKLEELRSKGVEVIITNEKNGIVDLESALKILGEKKITSVMVEAGPTLLTSFLKESLFDKIYLFIAPKIFGADSKSVFSELGLEDISKSQKFSLESVKKIGEDLLLELYPKQLKKLEE
ncbi:bifunctional diaminohydroxyphosphoribosylaminopyrimidine deaminase/5-amino-6-(5-phosphoribosylamino)uracil reductase RibD [Pseudothermotoga thermarum]|uniref:Riboflavin biosynthesis protein RibD n=1 Tax=Pseudothermotoga thermarum DSM 5069 TaxID=688269 RepID=F7YVM7_9THEM|nr:bifunctional diaminohydroxyphosphoribosylaminopyrimidine deaminase/5-amino-6-(5-phosphoribosylamino)uracil reductase RibD [Pseudothermotoga thermarum]AEH51691.1 diaminohydroxyphosphoribosylaminopyrimidine deaminase; 5-amino-6-(5-phosphoribosylamino)uracil reductase [Pseudothermotoga thermarum DSM 5069]